MVAFQVLEGVPGLLVGSTLLDLVFAEYYYEEENGELTQGVINISRKNNYGKNPTLFYCTS